MSLRDDLMRDEGCKLVAYKDTLGIWTCGYGHTGPDVVEGLAIDHDIAEKWLDEDIAKHAADLDRACPWAATLPGHVLRGLLNMCFNVGLTRLLGFHKMLAALQAGLWETAATEALDSIWAAEVGERAVRIAGLFRGVA